MMIIVILNNRTFLIIKRAIWTLILNQMMVCIMVKNLKKRRQKDREKKIKKEIKIRLILHLKIVTNIIKKIMRVKCKQTRKKIRKKKKLKIKVVYLINLKAVLWTLSTTSIIIIWKITWKITIKNIMMKKKSGKNMTSNCNLNSLCMERIKIKIKI